ncbi:MAG: hypothetical protein ABSB30_08775 [Terracidiphilus sp.]|jgi:hypothetical protein
MRKWGIIITLFYALIVLGLLLPVYVFLAANDSFFSRDFNNVISGYEYWGTWLFFAVVLSGQAILLFLSVDTSFKRRKPRAHIAISYIAASILFALLTFAAIFSLGVAAYGDHFGGRHTDSVPQVLGFGAFLWLFWGILFYLYFRNSIDITTRLVSWLLRGSVLELLIAIPSHVIVRRRNECTAPIVTSFGIVTGIAVMLLCFGPSVLLLYKKRMDAYGAQSSK